MRPAKRKYPHTTTTESDLVGTMKIADDYKGALRVARRVMRDRA